MHFLVRAVDGAVVEAKRGCMSYVCLYSYETNAPIRTPEYSTETNFVLPTPAVLTYHRV
jgi:hypothetical protein